nr:MAG TPA: hypothetical protein [Caudoviricetes sp.]
MNKKARECSSPLPCAPTIHTNPSTIFVKPLGFSIVYLIIMDIT